MRRVFTRQDLTDKGYHLNDTYGDINIYENDNSLLRWDESTGFVTYIDELRDPIATHLMIDSLLKMMYLIHKNLPAGQDKDMVLSLLNDFSVLNKPKASTLRPNTQPLTTIPSKRRIANAANRPNKVV